MTIFKGGHIMRLSTTINPFILPNNGTMTPYFEDMRCYNELGYDALDCIFCSADAIDSPLMDDNWEQWVDAYAEEAARLGIVFGQSHMPFYNFANQTTGQDERKDEASRRSILAAA